MTKFLQISAVAIVALYGYAVFGQTSAAFGAEAESEKAPSARSICGYKWREAKKADPSLKGREAWSSFQTAECGGKSKTRNDDAIKRYLDQHGSEQKTEVEPIDEYED